MEIPEIGSDDGIGRSNGKSFNNTELDQYELLIRESIQNYDEILKDNDEPVRIVIRSAINKGDVKKKLSKRLQLHEFIKRSDFFTTEDMEWFRLSNTCLTGLDDPDEPLSHLLSRTITPVASEAHGTSLKTIKIS